jgi:hypothetical protein
MDYNLINITPAYPDQQKLQPDNYIPINKQTQIQNSEAKLQTLRDQFLLEAVFNSEHLSQAKLKARSRHPKLEKFDYAWPGELIQALCEKFQQGWTFENSAYSLNISNQYSYIFLKKPQDIFDSELAAVDQKAEEDYRQEIEEAKLRLSREIAETSLLIKKLKAEARKEDTAAREFEKELDKVLSELIPDDHETTPSEPA